MFEIVKLHVLRYLKYYHNCPKNGTVCCYNELICTKDADVMAYIVGYAPTPLAAV